MTSLDQIEWPSDNAAAVHAYLQFVLKVLADLKFDFPGQIVDYPGKIVDPMHVVQKYLSGQSSADEMSSARAFWSEYMLTHFTQQNQDALIVKLALCLLPATELATPRVLSEYLSCFLEFLQRMGKDDKRAEAMLHSFFKFSG